MQNKALPDPCTDFCGSTANEGNAAIMENKSKVKPGRLSDDDLGKLKYRLFGTPDSIDIALDSIGLEADVPEVEGDYFRP